MGKRAEDYIDEFYKDNGPCCAGCSWWKFHNSVVGDCTKSAPVGEKERHSMLGIESCSLTLEAGHVLTTRYHVCGDFDARFKLDNKGE